MRLYDRETSNFAKARFQLYRGVGGAVVGGGGHHVVHLQLGEGGVVGEDLGQAAEVLGLLTQEAAVQAETLQPTPGIPQSSEHCAEAALLAAMATAQGEGEDDIVNCGVVKFCLM